MGYEILSPHPSRGYMATLHLRREQLGQRQQDVADMFADGCASEAAVLAEIEFRETGVARPLFVAGCWWVADGFGWREVASPAGVPREVLVGA